MSKGYNLAVPCWFDTDSDYYEFECASAVYRKVTGTEWNGQPSAAAQDRPTAAGLADYDGVCFHSDKGAASRQKTSERMQLASHQQIVQLVLGYTLAGAFVFTVVVTCLSLVGWIKFADSKQQKKLFSFLIVELVVVCIAFFKGFIKLNPTAVAKSIQIESQTKGDLAKAIGVVDFAPRANDYLPQVGNLIAAARKEIFLAGVSFYVTIPERNQLLERKIREGVKVRILIFDYVAGSLETLAQESSQTPESLRAECVTTLLALQEIQNAVTPQSNLEVRLYREIPKGRYYSFDGKLMFFVPHVVGINSPNSAGILLTNVPGGFAALFTPSLEALWERSVPFQKWIAANPDALRR